MLITTSRPAIEAHAWLRADPAPSAFEQGPVDERPGDFRMDVHSDEIGLGVS